MSLRPSDDGELVAVRRGALVVDGDEALVRQLAAEIDHHKRAATTGPLNAGRCTACEPADERPPPAVTTPPAAAPWQGRTGR